MGALYRKELRSLWPFLVLTFLLMCGDLFTRPWTERLDEQTWEHVASYLREGESDTFGWVLLILAVSIAYSAFPREHDEKTIHYLRALPVRPTTIFVAKVAAGLTLVWLGVGMLLVSDSVQSVWNQQSFSGSHWRADLALQSAALQLVFGSIVYTHGLLASVLRRFGVLPYALLLVVASILEDVYPPAAWIDPTELLATRYEGRELVIAWAPWAVHSAIAFVVMITAYAAWMGPAEDIGKALARARASLVGKLAFGCGTVVVGAAVLVLSVVVSDETVAPSRGTRQRHTERYLVTYPVSHERQALELSEDIDALHRAVQRELGASEPGPQLVADLTEVSPDHLGIASWTHIRVGLVTERDPVRLRHTFAHETVHAFQHRLSDLRQSDAARSTRFFAEGSAEQIGFRVAPNPAAHRQARVVAAASWSRHQMRSEMLIDDERLRAEFDRTLVYSLGERWAEALTRQCGPRAIGDALRAMAREGAPRQLAPRAFWEDTLRASECDYESVDQALSALMEAERNELQEDIERLPRLGGGVVSTSRGAVQIVALLDRDSTDALSFYAQVRADADSEDTETFPVRGRLDAENARRVTFRVPRALIPASRFQLQFCVRDDPRGWPFCERWQWASAR